MISIVAARNSGGAGQEANQRQTLPEGVGCAVRSRHSGKNLRVRQVPVGGHCVAGTSCLPPMPDRSSRSRRPCRQGRRREGYQGLNLSLVYPLSHVSQCHKQGPR